MVTNSWNTINIGQDCTLKARIGWQGLTTEEYKENGNYLLVTGTDFDNGLVNWDSCYYIDEWRYLQDKNIQLKKGDVLITKDGTIGKVGYVNSLKLPATLNSGVFVIRPKNDNIYPKYLYYVFSSNIFKEFLSKLTAGSTINHLYQKDFVFFEFKAPDYEEQKAIAKALSDTDSLISSLEELITKKEHIKTATMQQLLTGKKRLDGFSGEWVEKKLGEIAKVVMGHSPSSSNYNFNGIGLPLVQGNADIRNRKTIIRKYTSQITRKASKNDLIMSVRAPVGEIAKATFDVCIGRGVCAIKIKNDCLYHYLIFLEPKWSTISTGSTFDSVASDEVNSFLIYLPSNENEQKAIAQILSDMDKEIEVLKTKLEKVKAIKKGMMQELLSGRVRLIKGEQKNA